MEPEGLHQGGGGRWPSEAWRLHGTSLCGRSSLRATVPHHAQVPSLWSTALLAMQLVHWLAPGPAHVLHVEAQGEQAAKWGAGGKFDGGECSSSAAPVLTSHRTLEGPACPLNPSLRARVTGPLTCVIPRANEVSTAHTLAVSVQLKTASARSLGRLRAYTFGAGFIGNLLHVVAGCRGRASTPCCV